MSLNDQEPKRLSDIMSISLEDSEIADKYLFFKLIENWENIVGVVAANHITPIKKNGETLVLRSASSNWSAELLLRKEEIIKEVIIEKEVEMEVNPLEYAEITNKNLIDNLSIIDEFKEKIVKYIEGDLIFLEDDVLVGDLKEIGLTFGEYEKYSNALTEIINYSNKEHIETLNDG